MALGVLARDVVKVVREGAKAGLLLHVVIVLVEVLQELVEGLFDVRPGLVGTGEAQHTQARKTQGFHHGKNAARQGVED